MRSIVLDQRNKFSLDQIQLSSDAIVNTLINFPVLNKSNLILSYIPYGKEVDILRLNQWILDHGKGLCLPRVLNDTDMEAVQVESLNKGFAKSRFGILEPAKESEPVDIRKINLILVPGLAFDWNGNRLGHGKGYYDRFLERCGKNTHTIGIAFRFQVFDSIPFDPHDKRMDEIVTESQL